MTETEGQLGNGRAQRYRQFNFDRMKRVLSVVESPLAVKLYLFFVERLNDNDCLLISHAFIRSYFGASSAGASRALKLLSSSGLVRIKTNGQGQLVQVSFNEQDSRKRYLTENDVKVAVVADEWSRLYGDKRQE